MFLEKSFSLEYRVVSFNFVCPNCVLSFLDRNLDKMEWWTLFFRMRRGIRVNQNVERATKMDDTHDSANQSLTTEDTTYATDFAAVIAACGFTWNNNPNLLTPENFPGEKFGGDYDLEWRELLSKSDGYDADEIDAIVVAWMKDDKAILGSASAGDGLFLAKEFKAGRRDRPNGVIVCLDSTSVGGELLVLSGNSAYCKVCVYLCMIGWNGDILVLLRKARQS